MNIFKLIKAQHKDTKKAVAVKQQVIDGLVESIDSAQALARVVHAKSFNRWDANQDKAAVTAFTKAQDAVGIRYQFMSATGRVEALRVAANEIGRSPLALKARLKALGKLPSRKTSSKADLQSLVAKKKK